MSSHLGSLLIAVYYAFVGHFLGDLRWLLAALLNAQLLIIAFWVGALAPLHRTVGRTNGAILLHRFGMFASGTVAVLVCVGLVFPWLMIGSLGDLIRTAYGLTLIAKIAVVCGLLGMPAHKKLRLVPALSSGDTMAPNRLRRSIQSEITAFTLILRATATLTLVVTPPVNL